MDVELHLVSFQHLLRSVALKIGFTLESPGIFEDTVACVPSHLDSDLIGSEGA